MESLPQKKFEAIAEAKRFATKIRMDQLLFRSIVAAARL